MLFIPSRIISSPANPSSWTARYRLPVKRNRHQPSPYLDSRLIATWKSRQPFNIRYCMYTLLATENTTLFRSAFKCYLS